MAFFKTLQITRSFRCLAGSRIPHVSVLTNELKLNRLLRQPLEPMINAKSTFSTSSPHYGLNEFIDDEENWGQPIVKVGRPWKLDELRLKSNSDLHKLWFVLLKERNMLLTVAELYKQESELLPSPERIFKVEESMENIHRVVKERDIAFNLLETGKTGEPEIVTSRNFLGLKYQRRVTEHSIPKFMNRIFNLMHPKYDKYFVKFYRLHKEKLNKENARKQRLSKKYKGHLLKEFPHLRDNKDFMSNEMKADRQ